MCNQFNAIQLYSQQKLTHTHTNTQTRVRVQRERVQAHASLPIFVAHSAVHCCAVLPCLFFHRYYLVFRSLFIWCMFQLLKEKPAVSYAHTLFFELYARSIPLSLSLFLFSFYSVCFTTFFILVHQINGFCIQQILCVARTHTHTNTNTTQNLILYEIRLNK